MLNNGIFSDILVNADGGSIKAHRAVLAARSPVFMCMFSIDLEEKEQCIVDISDMSLEACRAFIRYIYGSIPEEEFLAHRSELLSAGDKYDIVELKNMCEISMVDDADNDNVPERLQMAHLYGLSTLKKTCMWLLEKFLKIYDAQEDFRELVHTGDPDLVAEVMQSCKGQCYRLRCWLQCHYLDWIHPVLKKEEDHT
nr:BTB/POZ domain-containing protein At1g55760-like [Setaria viridis]